MTEKTYPAIRSMRREGHTEHYTLNNDQKVSIRVDWTVDDACTGLIEEWIETRDLVDQHRVIRDADGEPVGVLVSAAEYREGRAAVHRINEDSYARRDERYMPFLHHPSGNTERLIDTDVLETVIKNLIHGKDAEITDDQRDRIHYAALFGALEFGFDADTRGIIPVLTPGRAADSSATEYYCSLLYQTPVPGLFLRPDDQIMGGIEYTLTTGSGYALVRGFWDRDYADELAVKLATRFPGINWFTARNGDDLTIEIKDTMRDIIKQHGFWRKDEK